MGNRSYLYLASPTGANEDFDQLAEANNHLPVIWKILLADGSTSTAITHQRVFDDAGSANICAPVPAALERLRKLAGFLRVDPRSHEFPAIGRYFDGCLCFLDQHIANWREKWGETPVFSADLDQLSWLNEADAPAFIAERIAEFSAKWRAVNALIANADHAGLDEQLEFTECHTRFADWYAWSMIFGFSGFAAEYFARAEEAPIDLAYPDYDPLDDPQGDTYLADGCYRYRKDGKWGVVAEAADGSRKIVLEAQWERLLPLVDDEERTDRELVVIVEAGKKGLAAYRGALAGQRLRHPELQEIWAFSDGLALAQQGKRFGYLDRAGQWLIAPTWDAAWGFANGLAIVRAKGKLGYVDVQGRIAIAPAFDEAFDFDDQVALVQVNGCSGLIGRDGQWVLKPEFDNIEWDAGLLGWRLQKDGQQGLAHRDGSRWLAPEWDEIAALKPSPLLRLRRGARYGAADGEGKLVVPLEFSTLHAPDPDPRPANVNREILLLASQSASRASNLGLWQVQAAAWLIADDYAAIEVIRLNAGEQFGFAVSRRQGKRLCVGVFDQAGGEIVPPAYAWIGEAPTRGRRPPVGDSIYEAWASGKPVPAGLHDSDETLWIGRDGSRLSLVDKLSAEYAAGKLKSALALAEYYRDAPDEKRNYTLARLWMGRAAGSEALPDGERRNGLLEARIQYAWLLDQAIGGERDAGQARRILEQAYTTQKRDARILWHLGCLLIDEASGASEPLRAVELFKVGARLRDAHCLFELARATREGWVSEPDPLAAAGLFKEAHAAGHRQAAAEASALYAELAASTDYPPEQRSNFRQLAEALRQTQDH